MTLCHHHKTSCQQRAELADSDLCHGVQPEIGRTAKMLARPTHHMVCVLLDVRSFAESQHS